jgi:hypothetical protein
MNGLIVITSDSTMTDVEVKIFSAALLSSFAVPRLDRTLGCHSNYSCSYTAVAVIVVTRRECAHGQHVVRNR